VLVPFSLFVFMYENTASSKNTGTVTDTDPGARHLANASWKLLVRSWSSSSSFCTYRALSIMSREPVTYSAQVLALGLADESVDVLHDRDGPGTCFLVDRHWRNPGFSFYDFVSFLRRFYKASADRILCISDILQLRRHLATMKSKLTATSEGVMKLNVATSSSTTSTPFETITHNITADVNTRATIVVTTSCDANVRVAGKDNDRDRGEKGAQDTEGQRSRRR
jgi:hypothetical protein